MAIPLKLLNATLGLYVYHRIVFPGQRIAREHVPLFKSMKNGVNRHFLRRCSRSDATPVAANCL